jgi:ferric-dicitrate binding protein FerR (iron transport regulator)
MTERWELVELIGQTLLDQESNVMTEDTCEAILDSIEDLIRANERAQFARWKAEATEVMREWERVWEALGSPGRLGESKAVAALALLEGGTA